MKRASVFFLSTCLLLSLCSCKQYRTDVTRDEIVSAYRAAGYEVWTDTYDEDMDSGIIAYVQANHKNGDYIHFAIFENAEDAKSYEKDLDHPVMKGLFSVIFGDPSWERMETYGCIVVSYRDPEFFEPFAALLKAK